MIDQEDFNQKIESDMVADKERMLMQSQAFSERIVFRVKPILKEKIAKVAIKMKQDEAIIIRSALIRGLKDMIVKNQLEVPLGFLGGEDDY